MLTTRRSYVMTLSQFMYKVYGWMSAALTISAVTAYSVYSNPAIFYAIMSNKLLFYGLVLAQLGLVIFFSMRLAKMSTAAASVCFIAYSVLTGITLSAIFAVYQLSSIYMVFGITAGIFGIMSLYGYFTKADLTSAGNFLTMALFGIILASVINMFLGNRQFDYVISFLAVLIFTGLTAYDVQKIKDLGADVIGHGESAHKAALLGALMLYLDFINLFLHLLNLLGKRKD